MKEIFSKISEQIMHSPNLKHLILSIGLKYNTSNYIKVSNYIKNNNIDDSHFPHPKDKLKYISNEVFIEAYHKSKSLGELLSQLGLNHSYYKKLHKKIFDLKLDVSKFQFVKWSETEIERLKENYPSKTEDELKILFPNRTIEGLQRYASYYKIKKTKNNVSSNLQILLNNNLESLYWIGFIMADGTIDLKRGRLKISVDKKDAEHLFKFKSYIECENLVKNYSQSKNAFGIGDLSEISLYNKNVIEKISEKFNLKPKKTYNPPDCKIFEQFEINQILSLIIGYIDGDGCIYKNKNGNIDIKIVSHESWIFVFEFWQKCIEKKFKTKIPFSKINKSKISQKKFSKKQIIFELKKFVEENNLPVLERKWNKISYS